MPVGQAVTATRLAGPSWVAGACAGAAAPAAEVPPAAEAAAADATGADPAACAPAGAAAGAGTVPTTSLTSVTTSSADSASRSAAVKAGFTSARASLVSSWRWVLSPPAGAAIRNARSAGPSLAPKSTRGRSRANTRVGSETPVVRQWGMAIPPGSPVGEVASRARTSSTSCSTSVARPASATTWARDRITSYLSEPWLTSRRTRSVVIRSDIFTLLG